MITRFRIIRNISKFQSFASPAAMRFARLTVIYAENGRGKTTVAAILRSLSSGEPITISERHRLGTTNEPNVIVDTDDNTSPAIFQNGAWSRTVPGLAIFDDTFIDRNVYSGLAVEPDHRQNLHELIIGNQGVALNEALRSTVARVEEHNRALRSKAELIPAAVRGPFSVDDFCSVSPRADVDEAIREAERNLAAVTEQSSVRATPEFEHYRVPGFDRVAIQQLLNRDVPALDSTSLAQVQTHINKLGRGGERWIEDGMQRFSADAEHPQCPFCSQGIESLPLIAHYRAYFSQEYVALVRAIAAKLNDTESAHGALTINGFARASTMNQERALFWARFCDIPDLSIAAAGITEQWTRALNGVLAALRSKQAAPLDPVALTPEVLSAIDAFDALRAMLDDANSLIDQANLQVRLVKERAVAGSGAAIQSDIARLRATKARFDAGTVALCNDYLAEKAAKAATESARDAARLNLDLYRTTVFPAYETAINLYLQRFNADFRVGSVLSTNTRGGSSCTYNVIINAQAVPVGGPLAPGSPSFRNTLSAGDRSTLALAFFFASLDQNPNLGDQIVILDDPITSLDDHRQLATAQEVRRLTQQVAQVIVLSHDKPFLCNLWDRADRDSRASFELRRSGDESVLLAWDVSLDSITEHDRRHALLTEYVRTPTGNARDVAESLRPVLEAFVRVSYPAPFPPGSLLRSFQNQCMQKVGTSEEILNQADTVELGDLIEYSNRFHHDTNPAWMSVRISDAELRGFVQRTLAFAKRS